MTNSDVSIMIIGPWVSYLLADGFELSGIVAILITGIFLKVYATPNLSSRSRKVLKAAYNIIAYAAETLVFIFLGIGIFAFEHPTDKIGFDAIIIGWLVIGFARAVNIFIITKVCNCYRTNHKITLKQ